MLNYSLKELFTTTIQQCQ